MPWCDADSRRRRRSLHQLDRHHYCPSVPTRLPTQVRSNGPPFIDMIDMGPPSHHQLSRLSNFSHGSTLSSVFSYEPLTPDTPRTFALPSVSDTEVSPTKLPSVPFRLQLHSETSQNVGLGLDLVEPEREDLVEEEEEESDPDPNGASKVLERLDMMLLEMKALTERGEMALATPALGARSH